MLVEFRDEAREMFEHGYNSYLRYGYPFDELKPLECIGRGRDRQRESNIGINDVDGDYCLTLVDSLDMLAVVGDVKGFEAAVKMVIRDVHFNLDSRIQVFEVTIRMMGGLLSAHLLATDAKLGFALPWYRGELLALAHDLGKRLLPAFSTSPTAFPFARVNLKHGRDNTETTETCTAGVGTLILEFSTLSRLTGDPQFEILAQQTVDALWELKTDVGLFGNSLDVRSGSWRYMMSGVGAGVDSWFEYLLKSAILLNDETALSRFEMAYSSLLRATRDNSGAFFLNVNAQTSDLMNTWVDSLSAFFPGLQVLAGDVENAIKSHLGFYHIWRKFQALPERFDLESKAPLISFYPLRPELIESTYMLYQATRDPFYLHVGEMILIDLQNRTRQRCGFAQLKNVVTGTHDDRMESFFLSETLKYLFLLFDKGNASVCLAHLSDNKFNKLDSNMVFTTEGHLLRLPVKKQASTKSPWRQQCDRFKGLPLAASSITQRPDFEYIRMMVGAQETTFLDSSFPGVCIYPKANPLVDILKRRKSNAASDDDILHQLINVEVFSSFDRKNAFSYTGVLAQFGDSLKEPLTLPLHFMDLNFTACTQFSPEEVVDHKAVIVQRGECPFDVKAQHAEDAGASAVIFAGNDDTMFSPDVSMSADISIPAVLITREVSHLIRGQAVKTPILSMRLSQLSH
ncbi:hypothetical protein DSO57_1001792 [Entomophthora muscae]|uniref:Uncharacterized protein n=1 Tax=Entomophthora muscae TaxID=34485 RepID=A0ACC2U6R4_9FUNG|nr:hypothetical protein DSO57_1001792 [Entomophthora muscae]